MKIALVLPPISLEERYGKAIAKVGGTLPPLGLLSLGTILKRASHQVIILDGSRTDFPSMLRIIFEEKPKIIGISVMTFTWPKVKEMIAMLKDKFPETFIVIGGVHATISKKKCLQESAQLDALVYGEGEYTLLELVNYIENGGDLNKIKGLIFRDNSFIVENPSRNVIENVDELSFPDRSLVNILDYVPAFSQYKKLPVTNIFTTRGCPYQCIFCIPDVLGKRIRYRSPEAVIEEIKYLKVEYGIKDIAFWDDTLTLNRKRLLEIIKLLKKNKLDILWSAQARANLVDKELLKEMASAGCWKIHYGLESMLQKNLDMLRKGTTVEQNFNAVKWTKEAKMEVEASFIFGIPRETFEDGLKTIKLVKKLDIDYARFFPLTPYGDLAEKLNDYGKLVCDDLSKFQGMEIVFVPYTMTKMELEKLITIAYTQFYFRPKYILKRVRKLTNIRNLRYTLSGVSAIYMIKTKGISKV
jgi:magnesium-protoporphyrin IX monomethyl ester (oxidative) cyclase